MAKEDIDRIEKSIEGLGGQIGQLVKALHPAKASAKNAEPAPEAAPPAAGSGDEEALYQRFKARLAKEAPQLIKVLSVAPELEVSVERKTIQTDESSAMGMIAILIKEGFLKDTIGATEVWKEMKRRWNYGGISARAYEQLDKLTAMGFVSKESDGYRAVPGVKVRIVDKAA